ncbi:uncharacterized protein Triagg1_693 [Trichoderma aggressivum f. europaeum]|uniref:Fungal STAND N-terminal Goodbye domain-containing protein n=1 Tax=Trichoderma aggressivum f. europaeum TaxID=173218 RepID=A0AAE1M7N5_9HYPO|nr:hypothetical protein Triagg1_693 [Trichoderma aggressivum f. europaeum]
MADLSIRGMWDEAGRRFQARTQKSLDLKPPKSIDDIRDMIERRYDPSSPADSDGGHEGAKRIGLNILSCLKLLGGVAAQGAELVFQPAGVCFNAISLLLDVPQSIHEFHGTIDAVFGIVGPTLSQFKIYERIELFNTIDPELNTAIHKVMISFVDICALAIGLQKGSRWKRFKAATKQALLNDDSGLKDEIDQFEKLVKGQQNVQATLPLEVALSAKADLATILGKACETGKRIDDIALGILDLKEAETNRSLEKSRQENLAKIRTKLAIDEKNIKASKDVCEKTWQRCITDSGNWLRDMGDYKKWSDKSTNDASPLLLLTGEAHSGKSSAMSTIVHQLKAAHESRGQSTARALVAYYFFPFFAKKADDDKRPGTTAVQDSGTAKSMAAFCDDKDSESYFWDSSFKDLWRDLKIGTPKPGTIHFIIIDGLDGLFGGHPEAANHFLDMFETIQSQTSTGSDGTRVRLIVSGKSDNFQRESLLSAPNIEIEKYNGADITSYIYEELKKTNLLQGEESETTRLRTKTALEKIKDLIMSDGSEAEMDTILDESNQDKRTISENVISELQQSLKPQSIEELNELLIWIVYGFVYFDAAELEAARFLRFGTVSLQKLEDKLKGMYSKLFFSHYGNVAILPSIEPLITKERDRPRISEDAPKISLNLTISNGDITTVQNFLWSFFQKSMVEKFQFEPISGPTRSAAREIQVNEYDAHLAIVKQSLRFLTSPPDERTKLLGTYIVRELHGHLERLNQAVGYDQILASDKKEIGDGLFGLFVSGDVIEKHWESFSEIDWVSQSDRIEIFRNWLKDPDAIGHLGRLDKDWLRAVNSSQRPNRELLTPMMKTVAEHWLLDNKWHAGTCFNALRLFLRLDTLEKPSEDESAVPMPKAISEELEAAEKWCQEILSPKTLGSLCECADASLSCFKSLAEAYYDNDELLSACSAMEKALDVVNAAETPDKDELKIIYIRLAYWYNHLQQPDRAIVHYEKALEVDPDNQEALSGILTTSIASGAEQAVYNLILSMSKLNSKEPGLDQLASTLLDQALDYSYKAPLRTLVHRCLSQQGCMAALLEAMDQAIEAARKKGMEIELLALLLLRGLASLFSDLQHSQSSPQAVAFWTDGYTTMDQLIRKADSEEELNLPDPSEYYLKLEELRRGFRFPGIEGIHAADLFTSAFHTLHGNRTAARETVKQYMRISMDNLADDTDENDYWAAYIQFKCLAASGDDLDALTAWSLLEPIETDVVAKALNLEVGPQQWLIDEMTKFVKAKCPLGATQSDRVNAVKTELEARLAASNKEGDESEQAELRTDIQKALAVLESVQLPEGSMTSETSGEVTIAPLESKDIAKSFGYTCDGTCGETPLDFNNGLNVCKYCWDVGFCDECLPQLKANKLKKIVCSPSHEWLAIPKWNPRGNAAARDGIVQVGGELVDGVRVGGETVTVKEWLASLKKEWEL